jgi:hypothetical protein
VVAPPASIESAQSAAPVVQLLWLEPGCADRLWGDPAVAPLLEALEQALKDDPAHAYARSMGLSPEAFREVLTVLARAEPVAEAGLAASLTRMLAGGAVVPPLAVTAGELEPALNPRDALGVAAEVAAALLPADEPTRAAVAQARAVPTALGTPGCMPGFGRPAPGRRCRSAPTISMRR